MYNAFSELRVEGQSEKLISKWIGRIQSGLPLFCFWLILFCLFVCFEMGDTCVQIQARGREPAERERQKLQEREVSEAGEGSGHNVSACFVRVSR